MSTVPAPFRILSRFALAALLGHTLSGMAADTPAAAGTAPAAAVADPATIPIADFFKPSQFARAALSPDGKNVALLSAGPNNRLLLAVMDVATSQPKILARFSDSDIGSFAWVNNKRLVYSLADRQSAPGENRGFGSGLFAVDIDGSNQRDLIEASYNSGKQKHRVLSAEHDFYGTIGKKDTDDIYVVKGYSYSGHRAFDLIRLNTTTGLAVTTPKPGNVVKWILDRQGDPRAATAFEDGRNVTYLKEKDNKWRRLFDTDANEDEGIVTDFWGPDDQLYVTALQDKNIRALYRYDLEQNKLAAEPVITLEGYDYNGNIIFNQESKKILGIQYDTDAPGTLWFDARYKEIQKKIDALLPGTINLISVRSEGESDTVLVSSFSDVDPGTLLLFNAKTEKVTVLGSTRPWINTRQMAFQDFVKFKARDGLTIPAYLTLPKGKKKGLPMVVMVHGGPNVRGEQWGWNPETQFLASRGYAVLQMEFRGSKGYGLKHESLGWKQWGLTMQDDVTDGTKWAIEQGIADPKKICIAGASYGGYASLFGLIKEPALYQCGFSWVGVTDLGLLYTSTLSDGDDDTAKYFLPIKVGDLKKDAAQFKATSVVENADKITQPLILAYGGVDRRVPREHGDRLMKAKKDKSNVEWLFYQDEGHGWRKLENNVDFWSKVEKLLEKTTKK
jgi:dipeptidyl aminopeptidase/acylaminoacyl peptidase